MNIEKLASAIYNDVVSGLRGHHSNIALSLEQLQDDIVDTRLQIIQEYHLKGIPVQKDLLLSINCVPVDCKNLEKCCSIQGNGTPTAHFEIPQILNSLGAAAIQYIGTTDKQYPFTFYTSTQVWNYFHKYRKRGKNKPYVYIDVTPNENGLLDCYIFNAPLIKQVSVVAVFKDPRQLVDFGCCSDENLDNDTFINKEIKLRLTQEKLKFYRQLASPLKPNTQEYTTG